MTQYRSREEVAELVMRIFDRLESTFEGAHVIDAMLLVEIDTGERVTNSEDPNYEEIPTVVLRESTSHRGTVDRGIMQFAQEFMYEQIDVEED